jgi:protein TonB
MLKKFTTLQIALAISLGVHAVLLTVRFVHPEAFNRVFEETPLEVILVNARSTERPDQAQAIAQANLAGGGNVERGRATSPLPPSAVLAPGNALEDAQRQIETLMEQQERLLASLRRELASLPPPDPRGDRGRPDAQSQEDKRRQLLRMLAEIEKRINEENARPKRRYISPSTREAAYALYYDQLRRKIEDRGTRNFPEHQGRKLYGELTMIVTVDALGRVVETEIVQSSGQPVLDRQAVAIVHAASPFGSFSNEMRAKADQLVVVSRFRFTREQALETTLSGN